MKFAIIGRNEILYETAEFLIASGHEIALIITSKEAPEYTKTAIEYESFAKSMNVPFYRGSNIDLFFNEIKELKIDIGVSMNYTGIISTKVISLFKYGILNAHGGDLPRYRGNACQAWAILNGESKIGLSIHKMFGGELDSGDIIAKEFLDITIETKIGQVLKWIGNQVPILMLKSLNLLSENSDFVLEIQSKDQADILRCYPRLPEDGRINWRDSAIHIVRLINASNRPYQGAFCFFEETKIKVWDATLVNDNENHCAVCGQVTLISKGYIEVSCGIGKIRIFEISVGANTITPDKLINSIRKRLK